MRRGKLIAICLLFLCGCDPEEELRGCIDTSKVCEECICPLFYQPVCGCDGKTYGNACEAAHAGIGTFTEGKCS